MLDTTAVVLAEEVGIESVLRKSKAKLGGSSRGSTDDSSTGVTIGGL